MTTLNKPLTEKQAQAIYNNTGKAELKAVLRIDLSDFIQNDADELNDLISDKLYVGMISDIRYEVVGFEHRNVILLEVTAEFDDDEIEDEEAVYYEDPR